MTSPQTRTGWWPHLWPLAAYLLLTLLLTYPLVVRFATAIPGDGFDGWQNYWNLWWMKVALLQEHRSPFTTDLLYHPTGVSLYFHTLNPFNGLLTLPVQLAWGLLPAYNAVVLFSFALGGYGAYLLARYVLGYHTHKPLASCILPPASCLLPPAFIAGLIYTFAPFHFAHLLGHMQVISLQWIPFYVLYLLRALTPRLPTSPPPSSPVPDPRSLIPDPPSLVSRDTLLTAFFLILVGLCDWYYVFYCLLFTALLLIVLACRRRLTRRAVLSVLTIGLIFGLALSPLLLPMLREARQFRFMVPDPAQTRDLSADLLAFVTPQEFHPLWGDQAQAWASAFTSTTSERTLFAGFLPLLLALIALLPPRSTLHAPRPTPRPEPVEGRHATRFTFYVSRFTFHVSRFTLWPLSLLLFFILSLGPVLHIGGRTALLPGGGEIPLPYALLHRLVPFLNISRSVSRFDVMVMLSLGVLAAFGLARVMGWGLPHAPSSHTPTPPHPWFGKLIALLSATLIIFEFLPAPYPMSPPDTPDWYRTLAAEPGDFAVLNLPMNWDRPGYLLYQTVHRKLLTAAYISRDDPRTLVQRAPVLQAFRHLGPDVIAHDLAAVAPSVFQYLDVRYVVLDGYKMPPGGRERQLTTQLAQEIFGAQPPMYADERLTVYRVQPPAVRQPFLILGEGWGSREMRAGQPWRAIAPESTLLIHAAQETTLRLRFQARAAGGGDLTLWLGDAVIGGFSVGSEPGHYQSGRFAVPAGDSLLRLHAAADSGRIALADLDIEQLSP
ncbi:MAG: hypothetical protein H8D78_10120 [Chloroflexi bacterium]|nr:hypothetical protein [Chloroflexota bacterium]